MMTASPDSVEAVGRVLVPREPTVAMLQGACEKHIPGRPMHDTTAPWPPAHLSETTNARILSRAARFGER